MAPGPSPRPSLAGWLPGTLARFCSQPLRVLSGGSFARQTALLLARLLCCDYQEPALTDSHLDGFVLLVALTEASFQFEQTTDLRRFEPVQEWNAGVRVQLRQTCGLVSPLQQWQTDGRASPEELC